MSGLTQVGATFYGVTTGSANPYGTIFRIDPDGTGFQTVHAFAGGAGGGFPSGTLVREGPFLYGMTEAGGANDAGTIFRIGTDGSAFSVLHSFGQHPSERADFGSTLAMAHSRLHGTTIGGSVFQIGIDGSDFKYLHNHTVSQGLGVRGTLVAGGPSLYGTTGNSIVKLTLPPGAPPQSLRSLANLSRNVYFGVEGWGDYAPVPSAAVIS